MSRRVWIEQSEMAHFVYIAKYVPVRLPQAQARLLGRNPATLNIIVLREFGKKERLFLRAILLSYATSKDISDKQYLARRLEAYR